MLVCLNIAKVCFFFEMAKEMFCKLFGGVENIM